MCLVAFGHRVHPRYSLVFAGNRDEFRARPTAPAGFWPGEDRDIVAGRDLQGGGTWLGVTRTGRFATVTNFRDPGGFRPEARSRGSLVTDFLRGAETPERFLDRLDGIAAAFNGFSLVLGDGAGLWYYSSQLRAGRCLEPGLYGLSNGLLNEPWPKVVRATGRLRAVLLKPVILPGDLLDLLADRTPAPDAALPSTGVGLAMERVLSPILIDTPEYGTVSSTAILIDERIRFVERTLRNPGGSEDREYVVPLEPAVPTCRPGLPPP